MNDENISNGYKSFSETEMFSVILEDIVQSNLTETSGDVLYGDGPLYYL